VTHYLDDNPSITALPITPSSLINFGEAVNFPLILGGILAVFGAATLAHLMVVSVSRRRREIGLLKVLGFVNRQVVASVGWQATTVAVVGIIIGVPLGVVAGRATWILFSSHVGVVPVAVVPVGLLGLLVVGVLVAANLLAIGPALVATRSKPGRLLRSL
jgi:ABC-type antimicrobial peptide transport system permease subunit